jgi:hypothetical protein
MTDAFWEHLPTLLISVATFLTTCVGLWNSFGIGRIERQVDTVHKATNSMHEALIVSTEKEAHARGFLAGIALEQGRVGDDEARSGRETGPQPPGPVTPSVR